MARCTPTAKPLPDPVVITTTTDDTSGKTAVHFGRHIISHDYPYNRLKLNGNDSEN